MNGIEARDVLTRVLKRLKKQWPDAKTFQAIVKIDHRGYGPGAGRNKKEAEQNAAAIAFAALKSRISDESQTR